MPQCQCQVEDRIVWAKSLYGIYSVKTDYYFWQNLNASDSNCTQPGVGDVFGGYLFLTVWKFLCGDSVETLSLFATDWEVIVLIYQLHAPCVVGI